MADVKALKEKFERVIVDTKGKGKVDASQLGVVTWKTMYSEIIIERPPQGKTWGFVRRKGKVFLRNYGRVLKNEKGLDIVDIIQHKIKEKEREISRIATEVLYPMGREHFAETTFGANSETNQHRGVVDFSVKS